MSIHDLSAAIASLNKGFSILAVNSTKAASVVNTSSSKMSADAKKAAESVNALTDAISKMQAFGGFVNLSDTLADLQKFTVLENQMKTGKINFNAKDLGQVTETIAKLLETIATWGGEIGKKFVQDYDKWRKALLQQTGTTPKTQPNSNNAGGGSGGISGLPQMPPSGFPRGTAP